jgi:very-short-patch-repair endonuclease
VRALPRDVETRIARTLRRDATIAEAVLWRALRSRGVAGAKFRRQLPVAGYVADFACVEALLVVEVDGGQHTAEADAARTAALTQAGWHVLRFGNHEVLGNPEGVLAEIARVVRVRRGS